MLSVLIPVYNSDVRELVRQLIQQLEKANQPAEIICIDDASQNEWKERNREISGWKFVCYDELEQNTGRSRIRNLLAEKAKYDWLLFMDGDSLVNHDGYIQHYLKYINAPKQLVYGGTEYGPRPSDQKKILHWLYGTERECVNAEKRNQNKFGTFKTNNFMISKWLFMQVRFDETVKGYGHEDTLFAQDLERKGFDILHIENPLMHGGLEENTDFLSKQAHAIDNLVKLYLQHKIGNEIRLVGFYNKMKKLNLLWLVKRLYLKNENKLRQNLLSDHPKLGNLDRLKLSWFIQRIKLKK